MNNNLINNNLINNNLINNNLKLLSYYLNDFDKLKDKISEILYDQNQININISDYLDYLNNLYIELNYNILEIQYFNEDKDDYMEIIKEHIDFYKIEKNKIKNELNEVEKFKINLNLKNKNKHTINHFDILQNENELFNLKNKREMLELKLENYNKNEKIINESIHNFTMDDNDFMNANIKLINLKKIIKWLVLEVNINNINDKNNRLIQKSIDLINEK
jgi:hypothetical protein